MPSNGNKAEFVIGVDVGGTKIYAGVFNPSMECVGTARVSTKAQRGPEPVIERIARCVRDAVDECDLSLGQVKAVGIGAPGAVDPEAGRVIFAPNLDWKDVPLKKALEKQLDLPVFVENDCNICALGVHEVELKGKPQHMIGIFIGTGIGGGFILNGEMYAGFNKTAGEVGHMVLLAGGPKCSCGNNGCFEALASRTAIFQQIKTAVGSGQKTVLTDMLGPKLDDLRSGDLRKAIRKGDKFVSGIVEQAAEYTGMAVANLINLLSPQIVVLGGGVIEALEEEMIQIITETATKRALAGTAKGVEIIASKLGDEAGIVGGAVLARRQTK
jgi:glucokinase